jgi:hypothetical protein
MENYSRSSVCSLICSHKKTEACSSLTTSRIRRTIHVDSLRPLLEAARSGSLLRKCVQRDPLVNRRYQGAGLRRRM